MDSLITPWLIWFLLGIGMAFLELYLPGFIVLFFGIGCWGTAVALLIRDFSLTWQILLFITISITSLLLLRKWLMRVFRGVSPDKPGQGFDDFPGGVRVTVVKAITPPGSGRIQYRGTAWDAVAEERVEVGATVEIVRYAGDSRQIFFVRRINNI
jgi:inner membrane protein